MNGTLVRTAKDHILHSEWTEITSEKVEIVFVRDDMIKKDVEDFVKEYTGAMFNINKLEAHEPEGLRVSVKFVELKDAVDFVGAVRESSAAKGVVQKIGYAPNESFSSMLYPTFLVLIFIIGLLF